MLRLFFMTLLIWIASKLIKSKEIIKNNFVMWSAIVISGIVFGAAHLPITASIATITPIIVIRALVLNGIGALVFGWLYWKKGLEFAMISHFVTDIVLHVIFISILMI
jgi:membrane protease YdiL (CAAX protease family)